MKIEGRDLKSSDYLSPVTYVPSHAEGNAGHKDCEQGVIITWGPTHVRVLYGKSRTTQATNPEDLVWG